MSTGYDIIPNGTIQGVNKIGNFRRASVILNTCIKHKIIRPGPSRTYRYTF